MHSFSGSVLYRNIICFTGRNRGLTSTRKQWNMWYCNWRLLVKEGTLYSRLVYWQFQSFLWVDCNKNFDVCIHLIMPMTDRLPCTLRSKICCYFCVFVVFFFSNKGLHMAFNLKTNLLKKNENVNRSLSGLFYLQQYISALGTVLRSKIIHGSFFLQ